MIKRKMGLLPLLCAHCNKDMGMLVGEPDDMPGVRENLDTKGTYLLCNICCQTMVGEEYQ